MLYKQIYNAQDCIHTDKLIKAIQEESAEKDKKINELRLEKDKEILVLKIKSTEKDAEIDALKQRLDALEKRFNQMLTKSNK